ncbi:MAG: nucleotidyltransferase domain-containing protein [Desulfurococcales archaeon]|nr:nucleotidyltransferase domain-containing protein [Desulfurococcales archaeon]
MIMEGFYVETSSIIYAVKGVCDYGEFVPVVPKYLKTGCRKVKDGFTHCYVKYLPSIGVYSCVIPKEEISLVYNPFEYDRNRIPVETRGFIVFLERNISNAEIGLSGSYLLGCPKEESDIDVIIYGELPRDEYMMLRKLLGSRNQCGDYLIEKNYMEKISTENSINLNDYKEIFKSKVLEGCFKGKLYSIRLIEKNIANTICRNFYFHTGHAIVSGRLIHEIPYTTPAIYVIRNSYSGYSYNVMTWRIRYTELPEGFYVIEGETFVDSAGESWIIPDHGGRIRKL